MILKRRVNFENVQTARILTFFNDIWRQIVAYCLLVASGASFAARCAIAIWSKDRKTIAKLIQCSGSQIPDLFCYRHFYLFSKIISYYIPYNVKVAFLLIREYPDSRVFESRKKSFVTWSYLLIHVTKITNSRFFKL